MLFLPYSMSQALSTFLLATAVCRSTSWLSKWYRSHVLHFFAPLFLHLCNCEDEKRFAPEWPEQQKTFWREVYLLNKDMFIFTQYLLDLNIILEMCPCVDRDWECVVILCARGRGQKVTERFILCQNYCFFFEAVFLYVFLSWEAAWNDTVWLCLYVGLFWLILQLFLSLLDPDWK